MVRESVESVRYVACAFDICLLKYLLTYLLTYLSLFRDFKYNEHDVPDYPLRRNAMYVCLGARWWVCILCLFWDGCTGLLKRPQH